MTATTLPLATVHGLYHIAIKTENLAATRKFWTEIIGLREFPRPDFGYPGAWLGCPQPGGLAMRLCQLRERLVGLILTNAEN